MFFTGRSKANSVRAGAEKGFKSQGWAHAAAMMFHGAGRGTPFTRRAGRPSLINMHVPGTCIFIVPGACIVPHHGEHVPLVPG